MMEYLTYIFYPNPGRLTYGSTQILILLAVCGGLVILSFAIRFWRRGLQSAITKKLSKSWSACSFWFGIVGLVLIVSRVEKIQFVAMRFAWVLWGIALLTTLFLQYRVFRMRHYEVLPRKATPDDPGAKYMPGKRK